MAAEAEEERIMKASCRRLSIQLAVAAASVKIALTNREKIDAQEAAAVGTSAVAAVKQKGSRAFLETFATTAVKKALPLLVVPSPALPSFKCTSNCRISTKGKKHQTQIERRKL